MFDMKEILTQKIGTLPASGIRKINEKALAMERKGENVIHLEIGRPDFDTPEYIKTACKKSIDAGNVFYTANMGTVELRTAIAEKLEKQNHVTYDPMTEILVSVGLSEAIFDVLSVILEQGDEILVPDPVWMNYINLPKFMGAEPITYSLKEENDYQIDIDEIRAKITEKTKALILISPNNPTGGILKKETLEKLAQIAKEKGIYVMADEVYERIIFDGEKHFSIASFQGMKERTITLNGFSKAYSMTGWRLGYVAAPKEIIAAANKVHQHLVTCAPSFVQAAGVIALREEKDEVENMVKEYQRRRDYLVDAINKIPGLSCNVPKGAFYLFVNVRKYHKSSEEIANYLLEEAKVALVPGSVFGKLGEGYIRLSYASSYENLVEAVARITKALSRLEHE